MEPDPIAPTFDDLLGLEILDSSDDQVRARVPVRDAVKQPMGLVHGGLHAAVAESLATAATQAALGDEDATAVGLATSTAFLRPITAGAVHAHARRLHRGRTTWVWNVELTDDAGRLCATVRMTVAVRRAIGPDPP
ncbi:MAG TPA: PaaI family thioesterase [Solirubrobacteraceae bacterium]|nr:PaaI family thioesterase [Solirubrobacteraceae bacterium]